MAKDSASRDTCLSVETNGRIVVTSDDESLTFYGPGWAWRVPPDQRWINAVTKARELGHRCWKQGDRRWVTCSESNPGDLHHLYMTPSEGPTCDCMGFQYNKGVCYHCGNLYLWLMRRARSMRLSDFGQSQYELFGDDVQQVA